MVTHPNPHPGPPPHLSHGITHIVVVTPNLRPFRIVAAPFVPISVAHRSALAPPPPTSCAVRPCANCSLCIDFLRHFSRLQNPFTFAQNH